LKIKLSFSQYTTTALLTIVKLLIY